MSKDSRNTSCTEQVKNFLWDICETVHEINLAMHPGLDSDNQADSKSDDSSKFKNS